MRQRDGVVGRDRAGEMRGVRQLVARQVFEEALAVVVAVIERGIPARVIREVIRQRLEKPFPRRPTRATEARVGHILDPGDRIDPEQIGEFAGSAVAVSVDVRREA